MNGFIQNLIWINAGIAALIIVLIVLRSFFLSNVHARVICILWTLVFLRMLVPLPIESGFSIIDNNTFLSSFAASSTAQETVSTSETNETAVANSPTIEADNTNGQITASSNPAPSAHGTTDVLLIVYICGAAVISGLILFTNMRFSKRIKQNAISANMQDADKYVFEQQGIRPLPLYVVNGLTSPCLYGLIKPKILLNEKSVENDAVRQYTIYHETTHYKHWDNIIFLGTVAACILNWFNPFMWLALYLSKKDREIYCDESVIKKLGDDRAIDYGKSLLYLVQNSNKKLLTISTTMTGSKREMKNRIKNIARSKKNWIILSAAIVLILAGIFILIGTQQPSNDNSIVMIGGADESTYVNVSSDIVDIIGVSIYEYNQSSEEKLVCSFEEGDLDGIEEFWEIYASSEPYDNNVKADHQMTAIVEYILDGSVRIMWLNYGSQEFITVTFGKSEQYFNIKNEALEDFLNKLVADSPPFVPLDKESIVIDVSDSSYEPMNDYIERLPAAFYEIPHLRRSRKPLNELFPAKEIPAEELSWFLASRDDVTVQACKGIRFANDDILIVYFYDSDVSDKTVLEYVEINIDMYGRSLIPPAEQYSGTWGVSNGFGVVAYSFYGNEMDDIIADVAINVIEH